MLLLPHRIQALINLGSTIQSLVEGTAESKIQERFKRTVESANKSNPWFTPQSIFRALQEWANALKKNKVEEWARRYNLTNDKPGKRIGVINAGNIPFVGLHDMLTVLLSGHKYIGKNASDDPWLLPFIASLIITKDPLFETTISFVDRLTEFDAVIATGSNNSARYFDYYFGKYPHIIRMNRNGISILDGSESTDELFRLGDDIFSYFGMGCRNVSKLYVPENYSFNVFFESIFTYNEMMQHHKYMNNFEYNNSVLLLKTLPFLQNNFLILREDERIASPISIVHYESYSDKEKLMVELNGKINEIQCIVTHPFNVTQPELKNLRVDFGKTQSPALTDYADGVDTMEFLLKLV